MIRAISMDKLNLRRDLNNCNMTGQGALGG